MQILHLVGCLRDGGLPPYQQNWVLALLPYALSTSLTTESKAFLCTTPLSLQWQMAFMR